MKNTLLACLLISLVASASATIEFAGYLTSGKSITFALIDTADGRNGFVELGGNFAGYQVATFSKETETLTLNHDNETLLVKLRAASFTIPAEITGDEREKMFFAKLREMQHSIGPGKKLYGPEDYMATAAQHGRVIVSREFVNGVETIVMELPENLRPALDQNRAANQLNFSLQMTRRDKTRVRLTIR